jgi:hypothetical protein
LSVGLAIVVVACVYFLIVSPGFRKFALFALVLAAGMVALLLYRLNDSSHRWDEQRASTEAPNIEIKSEELLLEDVALKRPSYAAADGSPLDDWILTGTVTNQSKYALQSMAFEVLVTDCPLQKTTDPQNCRTIGQQGAQVSSVVPSGQTRAFSSYALRFQGMPAAGNRYQRSFSWKLIQARPDVN